MKMKKSTSLFLFPRPPLTPQLLPNHSLGGSEQEGQALGLTKGWTEVFMLQSPLRGAGPPRWVSILPCPCSPLSVPISPRSTVLGGPTLHTQKPLLELNTRPVSAIAHVRSYCQTLPDALLEVFLFFPKGSVLSSKGMML